MLLVLLLLTPILVILYFEIKVYKVRKMLKHFPGPPTVPILGNALHVGKTPSEMLRTLFMWWKKSDKKTYVCWLAYVYSMVVADVKDVEAILSSNTLTRKSDVYDMIYPWLGTGLLTSYGQKWHKHRKMITPSFHFKILQNFHDVMNSNSTKFIEKLRHISAGETIFDFQEVVHYFTLDVICDTAMGVSINAMDNKNSEIVTAFQDMCYSINMRAFHPLKSSNFFFKFFPEYAIYKKNLKTLQDFTNDVIDKRIKLRESLAGETTEDEFSRNKSAFLDTLLTATVDDRPLTRQELYEEVSTFMFEGHDTTTSGIAFTIYLLSRHPEIQKKVFAEQQQVMGNNLRRDATFQEIADMKYLDLVIKESLRLYPSVPIIGRKAEQEYNFNGTIIPKGTDIGIFIIAMGYNDELFPDPYRFKPERFDYDNGNVKQNPFEYVPFSAGPRNCIGQKFALLELKTVISKIVRYFEILPVLDELISKDGYVEHDLGLLPEELKQRKPKYHKYNPILSMVLTLKSENGLHIRLRERN